MQEKEFDKSSAEQQRLVVKNKKFRRSDVPICLCCLLAALIIWIHVANIEKERTETFDKNSEEQTEQA